MTGELPPGEEPVHEELPDGVADFGDPDVNRPFERFKGECPIVVEGLTNKFGDAVIHEGLSLKVKRGEILGVVGG